MARRGAPEQQPRHQKAGAADDVHQLARERLWRSSQLCGGSRSSVARARKPPPRRAARRIVAASTQRLVRGAHPIQEALLRQIVARLDDQERTRRCQHGRSRVLLQRADAGYDQRDVRGQLRQRLRRGRAAQASGTPAGSSDRGGDDRDAGSHARQRRSCKASCAVLRCGAACGRPERRGALQRRLSGRRARRGPKRRADAQRRRHGGRQRCDTRFARTPNAQRTACGEGEAVMLAAHNDSRTSSSSAFHLKCACLLL